MLERTKLVIEPGLLQHLFVLACIEIYMYLGVIRSMLTAESKVTI